MSKIRTIRMATSLLLLAGLIVFTSPAVAQPSLQLDILNGIYIPEIDPSDPSNTGTTYSQGSVFTLYALLIQDKVNSREGDYVVSASIAPKQGQASGADFGSISFGSNTLNAGNMFYGTPPSTDPGELPSHGMFPTYYWEYGFTFASAPSAQAYDVQDAAVPHTGPVTWDSGKKMYYMAFDIDTSGLMAGYAVHFDLYSIDGSGNYLDKAPFSHDAQTGNNHKVPEPGSLVLLGFGLVGISLFGRKKR